MIKILGSSYNISQTVTLGTFNGTIDSENTSVTFSGSATESAFAITGGSVTFTNIEFNGTNSAVDLTRGAVTLYGDTINANVVFAGGIATLDHSTLAGGLLVENLGTVNIESSIVRGSISGPLGSRNGTLAVNSTLFQGGLLSLVSFSANVTNNVFVSSTGSQLLTTSNSTGAIEFNTFVNTGASAPQAAIQCSGTMNVDSNIFVWGSASPESGCSPTYSLFDTAATLPTGTGNISGNASTFFVNLAGQDFHLATGSPAVGAGDPASTVASDYDGDTRPNPAGSRPDIGSFESPQ